MLAVLTHSTAFYEKLVHAYFEPQGVDSQHYSGKWNDELSAILIIDPDQIAEEWLNLGEFWRRSLLERLNHLKVVIGRFEGSSTGNILNLHQLPEDWKSYVNNVTPISDMEAISQEGLSLEGKFRKFMDGHGEESLLKLITQLRSSFDTALFMLDDGADFDEVWESMLQVVGEMIGKQLVERWEKYRPYFKPTPFYEELQAYDAAMFDRLVDFFTGNPQEQTVRELTPQLTQLSQFLREIDQATTR